MADYSPMFLPGASLTGTASAPITGGQHLEVSGNDTVAPTSGISAKAVGVAAFDAGSGTQVTYYGRGTVHYTNAVGGITAGDQLVTATGGGIATLAAAAAAAAADINNGRAVIGVAMTTATNGTPCKWMVI